MKSYQQQYYNILTKLVNMPTKTTDSRVGDTNSNFVDIIRINLQEEFPLMEIKKLKFNNILHELLWFISGNTNIKYLYDNNCHIWDDDAYRYYKDKVSKANNDSLFKSDILSKEEFLNNVKKGVTGFGEMDRIYGFNWRKFNGVTDQLSNVIKTLKTNPSDRRMIITGLNPTDIEQEIVGLPACHNMMQFYTKPLSYDDRRMMIITKYGFGAYNNDDNPDNYNIPEYYINLWYNVRSQDFFLGNPYNVASYSILLYIIGKITNMVPNELVTTMIDNHLYTEHIEPANEWLNRYENIGDLGYCNSKLVINGDIKSIDDITFDKFELQNYKPNSYIKAKLLT